MKSKFEPSHFFNRELSLLEFNQRVLAQALNDEIPALERLKYLCIVSSNLDEFFEIRVAGLKEQVALKEPVGADGLNAAELLKKISQRVRLIVMEQYQSLNKSVLPALAQHDVHFFRRSQWTPEQRAWLKNFFHQEVLPVLTPIGLDPAHPFPRVLNKSLNFIVELNGKDAFGRETDKAIVQAPRILPRPIALPKEISGCQFGFVILASLMHEFVGEMFGGLEVVSCHQFRVTRNSDLYVDEEEMTNLRAELQGELLQRHFGHAVRLEISHRCPEHLANYLLQHFDLQTDDMYRVDGPVNLVRLMDIPGQVENDSLKFPSFTPGLSKQLQQYPDDIFAAISKSDILLHHPFQSFQPVIDFIQQAAIDPDVVAIKQTVYRTGVDSVLMEALIAATQKGKEVTVVVELLARFDEQANINWASKLEQAGAHVVYGIVGHKTHAKMLLVVRRENGEFKRYAHLGTGNYHPRTARLYTDFGLFTAHPDVGQDVHQIFAQLTGLGNPGHLKQLWQSPFTLHSNILSAIQNEIDWAQQGKPAHIIAKMNSLLEPKVIEALYKASQAGVKIDLLIRGACALRPNIKGLSENIRVRSIIGRFLEHPRIFYFCNNLSHDVYLSSADWMDRNFFRRVETCFPILNKTLKQRVIRESLKMYLEDNSQAWELNSEGQYIAKKPRRGKEKSAQKILLALLSSD